MKIAEMTAGGFVQFAGAAAAAGGGVLHSSAPFSLALTSLAGVCAIIGGLYYRAAEKESAMVDIAVSLMGAFAMGVAFGPALGEGAFAVLNGAIGTISPGFSSSYETPMADHVFGGLIAGALMTPLLRAGIAMLRRASGGNK